MTNLEILRSGSAKRLYRAYDALLKADENNPAQADFARARFSREGGRYNRIQRHFGFASVIAIGENKKERRL